MFLLASEVVLMSKSRGHAHTPLRLSASLIEQLNLYALAASAAGVSLPALAQLAEAKIVYTKTHHVIGQNSIYPLDLNHDGTIDFLIQEWGRPGTSNGLWVKEAFGNAVEVPFQGRSPFVPRAAALHEGALIDTHDQFISTTGAYGEVMVWAGCATSCSTYGQWVNVKNRYLGLRFQIGGKTHYGWARMSVQLRKNFEITATLTGYAYETVPRKAIRAGQTSGQADEVGSSPDSAQLGTPDAIVAKPGARIFTPASLGQLALGASAVPLRRRP